MILRGDDHRRNSLYSFVIKTLLLYMIFKLYWLCFLVWFYFPVKIYDSWCLLLGNVDRTFKRILFVCFELCLTRVSNFLIIWNIYPFIFLCQNLCLYGGNKILCWYLTILEVIVHLASLNTANRCLPYTGEISTKCLKWFNSVMMRLTRESGRTSWGFTQRSWKILHGTIPIRAIVPKFTWHRSHFEIDWLFLWHRIEVHEVRFLGFEVWSWPFSPSLLNSIQFVLYIFCEWFFG